MVLFILTITIVSCKKDVLEEEYNTNISHHHRNSSTTSKIALQSIEKFETASKNTYSTATVNLSTGPWLFEDALIGTSSSDKKIDLKSVRIQNLGSLTMLSNYTKGASIITLKHAKYGSDASSTWNILYSLNNGLTWTLLKTVTSSNSILTTEQIGLNVYGNIRLKIQKTSGGRLNIDNVTIDENDSLAYREDNMLFGNPSNAVTNILMTTNYLLVKNEYSLSYNNSKGISNWVSWHLSSAWMGTALRCDCWGPEPLLPSTFFKAKDSHYDTTGFDRGHLCPSEDRGDLPIENKSTFYTSNCFPQAPFNNQQIWRKLESYCQSQAKVTASKAGNEMYIISGTIGAGGIGAKGFKSNINNGNILVPEKIWKVIVILKNGSNDLFRVNNSTRIISVIIPNTQASGSGNWGNYRVKVDDIEAATGLDLLNNLPISLQTNLEQMVDTGPTI